MHLAALTSNPQNTTEKILFTIRSESTCHVILIGKMSKLFWLCILLTVNWKFIFGHDKKSLLKILVTLISLYERNFNVRNKFCV